MKHARVFVAIALMGLMATVTGADDGRIEIGPTTSFPIKISQPGSYVLTADLTVTDPDESAIEIITTDVSIDLAGHVIQGTGQGTGSYPHSIGVGAVGGITARNLRISNGIIRGFYYGVFFQSTFDRGGHRIAGISVSDCYVGVMSTGAVIVNTTARYNDLRGFQAFDSVLENCSAQNNGERGFYLSSSVLRGSIARSNTGDGIYAVSASLVEGCSSTSNTGWGINMGPATRVNIVNCVAWGNTAGNLDLSDCAADNGCHHNYAP